MLSPQLSAVGRRQDSGVNESPRLDVVPLREGEDAEWDRFVIATPAGTLFHLTSWRKLVEKTLGHQHFCLVARRRGEITGVFPISRVRSPLFGSCLVSEPLAVYGGICAADAESHSALLRAGGELAQQRGVKYLEMRNRTEDFVSELPGRNLYVTFTQDLTPGADALFKGLPRDTRYAIRKGQKAGLEWKEDLTDEEFYEIYAQSVRRLGTPVFSRQLFTELRAQFGRQARLFGVRKNGVAIAGVLCLYFRDEVLPYYGGALSEFYKDSPNNFMYWSLLAQSCEEGYRRFDFGRSKRGTGSFEFKSAWSMTVSELPYRYVLVKAKAVPEMTPVDKKFKLPVAAWKRMPYSWTKIVGPRLIRWIPSI